ncbi:hypothetical protein A2697_05335 [Candidatus Curtissbacteria bacterium RIFCSPHIGHO2_01_FULL_41_44]|uniref:Ketosynthase family 3 (KS3) domain-containing protein n=1 Tax=Candidatus Curtissbacteria bacterium RIFCSPLOWO2_01_FULL_42_50 TaxID=1797730 RepID=A0A1F5H447_9BACT|nr:MAG: hypothetical protein A2697_05335 [Candidatus Curtissbacteria bacterium RIFCSPHIGHO2_01_FULL_41_44]OGD93232.1 MAG: hypothetical protein A3C33_04305 [Candidatus Curtissbacteria bacterium RIFCSPHIGHO2_02_FULL_42_58]OGD96872.1 MAG: hypothetical protein A3E71_00315 [Candidatus Curtissbacteria bacterium RIFCSPHIGHO2_12_FULL_42_33]OGD98936.1 MAG: hypothetical protein A3B54_01135 [Candidatus Curtissbacteria bacterium RIFCSPLOWO2_01_FULL_42_50]OGE03480.1 MAG: hypothetical protein A3G16_02695 [Ca
MVERNGTEISPKEHEVRPGRRVVVTGIGAVSPYGMNVDEMWQNVLAGISRARVIVDERFRSRIAIPMADYDQAKLFTQAERKIRQRSSRASQYSFLAAKEALADGGHTVNNILDEGIAKSRFGVFVGTGIGGMEYYRQAGKILEETGPKEIPPSTILQVEPERVSSIINLFWHLKGWSGSLVTACSTGIDNMAVSALLIRLGINDYMVCGGTEGEITDIVMAGFGNMEAMADGRYLNEPWRASRPFNSDSTGFVPSEGASIMILEAEEVALKRNAKVYAELVGVNCNNDGNHETVPGAHEEAEAISNALEDANVKPEEVDLYVAHATSTGLSEKTEMEAVRIVFGDHVRNLAICAPKSIMGHQLGAAGATTALFAVKAIYEGVIPPTINIDNVRPEFADLDIVKKPRKKDVRVAVAFSAGFGGYNGVLVFKKYIP